MTTTLVLGATGKTGRRITEQLVGGGHTARAAARNPGPAAPGIVPVHFDWDNPDTHAAALDGADAVYMIPPAFQADYATRVHQLAEQAVSVGARRVVLLSARGVDKAPPNPQRAAELALADSGADWAVLRPSFFAQDFTEAFLRPGIDAADTVDVPVGAGAEPWIDAADIAAAAVALLTGEAETGCAYDLSGPETLTMTEALALLSPAAGRTLRFVDQSPQEWQRASEAAGVPADYVARLGRLYTLIREGRDNYLSDGVEQVLGRAPTRFEDWAAREGSQLRR